MKTPNIFNQEDTSKEVKELLDDIKIEATKNTTYYHNLKLGGLDSYKILKKKDTAFKKEILSLAVLKVNKKQNAWNDPEYQVCTQLISMLLRSKLDFSVDEVILIFKNITTTQNLPYWFPAGLALKQLENAVKANGLTEEQTAFLEKLQGYSFSYRESEKSILKIKEIIAQAQGKSIGEIAPVLLDDEDELGKAINEEIAVLEDTPKIAYYELFTLFKKATQGKPTAKFQKSVAENVAKIDEKSFLKTIKNWLSLLKKISVIIETHTNTYRSNGHNYEYTHTTHTYLRESNLIFVKGLIWSTEQYTDAEILQLLADYAEKCYKKIPGKGPLAMGAGNACLYVLAQSGLEGVSYLSRLKLRIRQSSTQALIEKYIRETAQNLGVTPSEIEDMATPSFGLEDGKLEESFGEYKAILSIEGIGKTRLQWYKPDGSPLKSAPSVAKQEEYKDTYKELKNDNTQIQKTLTAQRDRLDRSLVEGRTWSWQAFQDYYFAHGLMSFLTKKLIWTFEIAEQKQDAFYLNGQWIDIDEKPLGEISKDTKVSFWHPIHKTADEILAWRNFLAKYEIQQPMKQAYREIYLLTDAEINTINYSNRMAAHVLKQHQFNALAKIRGWKYSLLGAYDKGYDSETASIQLPDDYKAEFWVQEVFADGEWTDSGIYNYVSTDQVRFYQNEQQILMADVPPLIFSEAMRDVDLFVGVASVGNDPNWRDGGLQQFRNYWESYSFGNLTEVAKTRKQVLERIIPRLKIAKQCEITDKFVVVKGSIRTYKIHIGSGNILMEPNDQYLCIVPDRKADDVGSKVFLPFEGDNVLSIIISKAFLLAEDSKITDSTIISQLR